MPTTSALKACRSPQHVTSLICPRCNAFWSRTSSTCSRCATEWPRDGAHKGGFTRGCALYWLMRLTSKRGVLWSGSRAFARTRSSRSWSSSFAVLSASVRGSEPEQAHFPGAHQEGAPPPSALRPRLADRTVRRVVEQRYKLSLRKMRGVVLCLEPGTSYLRPARSLVHSIRSTRPGPPGRSLERIGEGEAAATHSA